MLLRDHVSVSRVHYAVTFGTTCATRLHKRASHGLTEHLSETDQNAIISNRHKPFFQFPNACSSASTCPFFVCNVPLRS